MKWKSLLFISSIIILVNIATASTPKAYQKTLSNGLDVVLIQDKSVPLISSLAIIRTGSGQETPDNWGVSHLVEHMLFRGTTHRSQTEIYETLDRMGVYFNAQTGWNHTTSMFITPSNIAEEALAIQADMLFFSAMDKDSLDIEKGRVISEIKRSETNDHMAKQKHWQFLFGYTGYGLSTLGNASSVQRLTVKDIQRHYSNWFQPNNCTLLIKGDFERKEMLEIIEHSFGNITPGTSPTPQDSWPEGMDGWREGQLHIIQTDSDESMLRLSIPAPRYDAPEAPAFDVLTGFLDKTLQAKFVSKGLAKKIESELFQADSFSLYTVTVMPTEGVSTEATKDQILATFTSFLDQDIGDEELYNEITRRNREKVFFQEQIQYGTFLYIPKLALAPFDFWDRYQLKFENTDILALYQTAGKWLDDPVWLATAAIPTIDSTNDGGIRLAPAIADTLESGLTLVTQKAANAPVAAIHISTKHRSQLEGKMRAGWADLLHRMIVEGNNGLLKEKLEALGATVEAFDDPRIPMDNYRTTVSSSFFRIQVEADAWKDALKIILDQLQKPLDDPDALERSLAESSSARKQQASSLSNRAEKAFKEALFPDQYVSMPIYGDSVSTASVTMEALESFRRVYFSAENLIISVITPTNHAEVVSVANQIKRSSQTSATLLPSLRYSKPEQTTIEVKGKGRQSSFRTGFAIRELKQQDFAAILLANAIYSNRIYMELSEKRGWAYSASSAIALRNGTSWWSCKSSLSKEHLEEAIDIAKLTMRDVIKNGFSQAELESARGSLRGKMLRRYSSRINLAMALCNDVREFGTPDETWNLYEALESVSDEEVQKAFKKYLNGRKNWVTISAFPDRKSSKPARTMPRMMMR